MTLFKLAMNPVFKLAARRVITGRNRSYADSTKGRFTRADANLLLKNLWKNFDELAQDLPEQPTFGARMNIKLACVTLSFYRSLRSMGIDSETSIGLISDCAWVIYRKWGMPPRTLSRLLSSDPLKRLRICATLFLKFPFNPPGYGVELLPDKNQVAFNITHCPVAEYFRSHDLPELCLEAWCNMDYPLAEMWGGVLERSGTLAMGNSYCDFSWKAPPEK